MITGRTVALTICCLNLLCLQMPGQGAPSSSDVTLRARDFSVVGDGVTDDGPALGRMLQAGSNGGVTFVFESNRVYRVLTAGLSPWVFTWTNRADVTLDGGGSVFLLGPDVRFMNVSRCCRVTVRNLSVDYDPLPFAEGLVVAVDLKAKTLDVRIEGGFALPPLGGPTKEREQSYFAMLWFKDDAGRRCSAHFGVGDVTEVGPGSLAQRVVRIFPDAHGGHMPDLGKVKPGETRITVPVRGVAHKMVAAPDGHVTMVLDGNCDMVFESVDIWSAPLFAVSVLRNEGSCIFRRFDIVPKPGSGRVTSSWRDGFHVKGNRAKLVWEDCRLEGMNDDAFNISTHASRVDKVVSPTEMIIRQIYPLNIMEYRAGDTVWLVDDENGVGLGSAKVVEGGMPEADGRGYAQPLRLRIDAPVGGVRAGCRIWNESTSNPGAEIRRCKVQMSCRFQSPDLLIDRCEFEALAWFYGEYVEGPMPVSLTAQDTHFTVGRGNASRAVAVSGRLHGKNGVGPVPGKPVIESARFLRCTFDGELACDDVALVDLAGSVFKAPSGRFVENRCGKVAR